MKNKKKSILLFLFVQSFLFFSIYSQYEKKIAFVFDGKWATENVYFDTIIEEMHSLLDQEFSLLFTEYFGDWTRDSAIEAFEKASQSDADIIIPFGVMGCEYVVNLSNVRKPIILPFEINLFSDTKPLSKDVAYFISKLSYFSDIKLFQEITHTYSVAVIGDSSYLTQKDFTFVKEKINNALLQQGFVTTYIPVGKDNKEALMQVEEKHINGVIFLPTYRMNEEDLQEIIDKVNALKLPSFSYVGERQVEDGVLMSTISSDEIKKQARRIALNTLEFLTTHSTENMDFDFYRSHRLIINATTVEDIHFDLSWGVMKKAKFIQEPVLSNRYMMDLHKTANVAIEQNLDLLALRYDVDSFRQNIFLARSKLLPQVNLGAKGRITDSNSAKYSRGIEPQNLVKGALYIDQMLYKEESVADYAVQKYLYKSKEFSQKAFTLDVTLDAMLAYLYVLRIKGERDISIENISLTKANLKRAKDLVNIGQARLSEVYRWESELGQNNQTLLSFQADFENAQTQFNRILNLPLEQRNVLKDVKYLHDDPLTLGRLYEVIGSVQNFKLFKEFMVQYAREQSPEIQAFLEQVYAQDRIVTSKKRAFYLPDFSLFGDVEKNIAKGGSGDEAPAGLSNTKTKTVFGVTLSYPLVTGGERRSELKKAKLDLDRAITDKQSIVQKIDARVLQEIDRVKSSYQSIFYAKSSKEAAEKNLVIVTNSYERGVVSIVDLIDAQNQAINSMTSYSNALYDYLIDLMVLQRAIGDFIYLDSNEKKMHFYKKTVQYIKEDK